MYQFLYITPIKTLVSTELKIPQKDNFTHVYQEQEDGTVVVFDNYENPTPKIVKDGCRQFVEANSVDYINTLDFFIYTMNKELSQKYKEEREEDEVKRRKFFESIDDLNDKEYEKEMNKYSFLETNMQFQRSTLHKIVKYRDFINTSDTILKVMVKKEYLEVLDKNRVFSHLSETLYNKLVEEIKSAKIELSFTKEDRKKLFESIVEKEKKAHEYFYSRPLRVAKFKEYGLTIPTFNADEYFYHC